VGLAGDSTGLFYGVIMQLDLFAFEFVKYVVMPYNSHPKGAICGKCRYFIQANDRSGFDGYCSFYAFDIDHIDQRPNDGTGWHFYTKDQICSIGNKKPATKP